MRFPAGFALVVVASCLSVSCAPSLPQEFAVTGAAPAPAGTTFRNSDPNINDVEAESLLRRRPTKSSASRPQPTDSGPIQEWRVRCSPYTLLSWIP